MRRALAWCCAAAVTSGAAAFGPGGGIGVVARGPRLYAEGDDEKQFDPRTLASRDKVSAYNRPAEDSALLSEAWKESEPDEGGGPGLGAVLRGVAVAALLAAFAMVPLGKQDVSIPANDPTRVPVTNFVKVQD